MAVLPSPWQQHNDYFQMTAMEFLHLRLMTLVTMWQPHDHGTCISLASADMCGADGLIHTDGFGDPPTEASIVSLLRFV